MRQISPSRNWHRYRPFPVPIAINITYATKIHKALQLTEHGTNAQEHEQMQSQESSVSGFVIL